MSKFSQFWAGLGELIQSRLVSRETLPGSVFEVAGRTPPDEERAIAIGNIWEQIWPHAETLGIWAWPIDVYADTGGELFAIAANEGRLYRTAIAIDENSQPVFGEWVEVVQEFTPVTAERSQIRVFRQADGRWRWVSVAATSVLNRVGEIDSRDLFDSFVSHAEETGEYPYRTFMHLGQACRTGEADYLARSGYCYITSGLYEDPDSNVYVAAELARLQSKPENWGESIGFRATSDPEMAEVAGITIPVFREGINREISFCPQDMACNLFTTTRISMEVARMTAQVREAFMRLFDGDEVQVEAAMAAIDDVNRLIDEENLVTRQLDGIEALLAESVQDDAARGAIMDTIRGMVGEGDTDAGPDGDTPAGDPVTVDVDEQLVAEIARQVPGTDEFRQVLQDVIAEALAPSAETLSQIAGQVAGLVPRLEVLEQADTERQARWAADLPASSPARAYHAAFRPSQARKTPDIPGGDTPDPKTYADQANEAATGLPIY